MIHRLWRAPLLLHACLLVGILVLGAWYTRPGLGWTSDEGAAILQAQLLDRGTWFYENPLPEADPEGILSPFPIGDHGSKGLAPYAKHPLYPRLLQAADRVLGDLGGLALSVFGATLAALAGALIAGRLRTALARPVLWILGLLSPLFIDAFAVLAHTLAAASFGWAVLAVWESIARRGAVRVGLLVAAVGLVAATCSLRTEGVLAGGALAVAIGVLAGVWRSRRALTAAIVVMSAVLGAFVVERLLIASILGTRSPRPGLALSPRPRPWTTGRVEAVWNDLIDPGVTDRVSLGMVAVLAALVILVAGALRARRDGRGDPLVLAASIAAVLYAVRLLSMPLELFGLFAAFPVLLVGLLLLTRAQVEHRLSSLLLTTSLLFAGAVLATNYPVGGSIQWGGRYFAVILPVVTPVAVDAIARAGMGWRTEVARKVVVLLLATSVLATLTGLRTVRHRHESAARLEAGLSELSVLAGGVGVGAFPERPAVVTYRRLVPQLLFDDFDDYVWLAPDSRDESGALAAAGLAAAGVDRVVLLGATSDSIEHWTGWHEVTARSTPAGRLAVIERASR